MPQVVCPDLSDVDQRLSQALYGATDALLLQTERQGDMDRDRDRDREALYGATDTLYSRMSDRETGTETETETKTETERQPH